MAEIILYLATVSGAVATLVALAAFWMRPEKIERVAALLLLLAGGLTFGALVLRGIHLSRFPLSGLYEFCQAFIVLLVMAFYLLRRRLVMPTFTLGIALAVFLGLALSVAIPHSDDPLMPALQSVWLSAHVLTAIIAYVAFAVAAVLGALYLIYEKNEDTDRLPLLDELNHKAIIMGIIFQTFLLVTGAVWAEEVWGAWWSWDPKETWGLITWLIYAIALHGYRSRQWKGRKSAIFSVLGILVVLFTLLGVTFLLPGMHSYL